MVGVEVVKLASIQNVTVIPSRNTVRKSQISDRYQISK